MRISSHHALSALAACATASAFGFSAQITDTKTDQNGQTGAVTVTYRLTGEDAVVTADVQTNANLNGKWTSIGPANYTGMTGDVWKKVTADGSLRTISWPTLGDGETKPPTFGRRVRVVLTAWSTNAPPDYLVINLDRSRTIPHAYYTAEALLPAGGSVTNKVYKDDFLVMKRIHAAGVTWMMGNDAVAKKGYAVGGVSERATEVAHPVMLTHDYYIGVYPITAAQHSRIMNKEYVDSRTPAVNIGYLSCRGGKTGAGGRFPSYKDDGTFDWETSHGVEPSYLIGKLRSWTGFKWIDIPTEAEWEFAARAGSSRGVYYTTDMTYATLEASYARVSGNKGQADCEGRTGNLATVGSYLPNGFGLYDMLGNASECVLDWYEDWSTCNEGGPIDASFVRVDPVGPATGSSRVMCGGHYSWGVGYTYIGNRSVGSAAPGWDGGLYGARVCLTLR